MRRYRTPTVIGGLLFLVATIHGGDAAVQGSDKTPATALRNGGFEANRFSTPPGAVPDNHAIQAWRITGRVGLNPVWPMIGGKPTPRRPVLDNGRIPEGKQAVFMRPESTLRQTVTGLKPGTTWVLTYHENAAVGTGKNLRPRLVVLLNNRVLVPEHAVRPVDARGTFSTPFRRITSPPFPSPVTGRACVTFLCSGPRKTAVGIDAVRLSPAPEKPLPPSRFPTAKPVVLNGNFEADHFLRRPGYAEKNGGITAWQSQGHAGVNPIWGDRFHRWGRRADFADNGRIPSGGQVAFIQNIGEIRQHVIGFRPGGRYRVVYFENGRVTRAVPDDQVLDVRIGDRVIVSPHPVPAVDRQRRGKMPYFRVESAPFPAPPSGEADLIFRTHKDGGTSVLLDDIRIEEISP